LVPEISEGLSLKETAQIDYKPLVFLRHRKTRGFDSALFAT
jgi:hypothetical protein